MKPSAVAPFLRRRVQNTKTIQNSARRCGLAKGRISATPARKGRFSCHHKNKATPSSKTSPICPETRQAGMGANVYPMAEKRSGGVPSPYSFRQILIATQRLATEQAIQTIQAPKADRSPSGATMNSVQGG